MIDIKELIRNTFGSVAILTITLFVIVYIVYGCSGIVDQLKETLTITIGFFGGFATLGAAYIAANLFDDWRDPYNKNTEKELISNVISKYSEMDIKRLELLTYFEDFLVNEKSTDNDANHLEFVLDEIKSLDIQLNTFSSKYNFYCSYSGEGKDIEFDKKITAVKRTIFEIDRQTEKQNKIKYIKIRLKHDLIELNDHFNQYAITTLMSKLKANI